jgi:hypothetical protein
MAEADPLQRIKSAAQRSEGPISVETQRQRHFAALDLDLGLDPETKRRRELAARPSRLPSLARVTAYIMLFCLLMVAAMTIRLAYDGTLTRFIAANMPKAPSQTGWMIPRDTATSEAIPDPVEGEANAATPLPSFVEPVVPPPLSLPPTKAIDETEEAEASPDEE